MNRRKFLFSTALASLFASIPFTRVFANKKWYRRETIKINPATINPYEATNFPIVIQSADMLKDTSKSYMVPKHMLIPLKFEQKGNDVFVYLPKVSPTENTEIYFTACKAQETE